MVNLSGSSLFFFFFLNRKQRSEKYIMTAAKLIAPAIETSFAAGFDWFVLLFYNPDQKSLWNRYNNWIVEPSLPVLVPCLCRCVDVVKSSQYTELADDLEIIKAVTYLRQKDFNQVTGPIHRSECCSCS